MKLFIRLMRKKEIQRRKKYNLYFEGFCPEYVVMPDYWVMDGPIGDALREQARIYDEQMDDELDGR